jgi:predicted nucleic acid-binding Zn ribbon protein
MSGHFFSFKNREKTSESKKNSLRENNSFKKLSLINKNSSLNVKTDDNQISEKELSIIKEKIKQRQRKETLIFGLSFVIIIILLIFIGIKYNVF